MIFLVKMDRNLLNLMLEFWFFHLFPTFSRQPNREFCFWRIIFVYWIDQRMGDGHQSGEDIKESSEAMENHQTLSSKEGKGQRLWNKVKYQLVEYHSLPGYLRDNEFIVGHYRSEWPLKQVLLSMFTIHNETLNVWT